KLDDKPRSAKGWFLLGKLYSSQTEYGKAQDAFTKAHELNPDDEQFTVFYIHSLWISNNQQFNDAIRQLFKDSLVKNPKQADALAMLAMDAFLEHHNEQAVGYWQRLLQLTAPQSEEAEAIRKAIAKAQSEFSPHT
ncbi:MAG: tetratricopeptide repeat protein, partial [Legionella sp.]